MTSLAILRIIRRNLDSVKTREQWLAAQQRVRRIAARRVPILVAWDVELCDAYDLRVASTR
jgi:hypothetical protein